MLRKFLLQQKVKHLYALREQKGQSLIIFVFAILGLIAMMGLALDLGLVYIERVRISRTTDAAALAAVVELPFEEESMRRAAEFIELNGYTREETEIRVRGCIDNAGTLNNVGDVYPNPYTDTDPVDVQPDSPISGWVYQPAINTPPRAVFVIDTLAYQPVEYNGAAVETTNEENCDGTTGSLTSLYGTANKLRVAGEVNVNMNFMQFFGFSEVPVSDQAVGENVTNLDVVVVFDVSGSMDFETTCFGCWSEDATKSADAMTYPFPSNGDHNPLRLEDPGAGGLSGFSNIFWGGDPGPPASKFGDTALAGHDLCGLPPTPLVSGGYRYSVHEAEFYSRDEPIHGWEFEKRNPGQGFWVLQRQNRGSNDSHVRTHPYPTYSQLNLTNFPQLQGGSYNAECFDGAGGLSGECWKTRADTLGEPAPSNPPFVEYDFTVDWAGLADDETHIWIRAIGGDDNISFEWYGRGAGDLITWNKSIYYQLDSDPVVGGPEGNLRDGVWSIQNDGDWRWVKITPTSGVDLADGQHTLKLYQGSSGFNLDKIVITNNPSGSEGSSQTNLFGFGNEGPAATAGSATREACNMCNPAYGNGLNNPNDYVMPSECSCKTGPADTTVGIYPGGGTGFGCTRVLTNTNQLVNDLYHDVDPLRSAQEAVRNFAERLDPKFDQIGFVTFSSNVGNRVKLMCRQYAGKHLLGGVRECYDPSTAPISYTHVIQGIEDSTRGGSTNIAQGMKEGLEELGISIPSYNTGVTSGCSSVTFTADNKNGCDRRGAARRILVLMTDGSPNTNSNASCPGSYIWRGQFAGGGGNNAYDCAMFYASQAADNNVVVYTIGIGSGVNRELLTAMATGTDPNPASGDDGFYFESKDGEYFPAAKPSDLDAIFEAILSNIYVRIVG
jgi:hypothetical protein